MGSATTACCRQYPVGASADVHLSCLLLPASGQGAAEGGEELQHEGKKFDPQAFSLPEAQAALTHALRSPDSARTGQKVHPVSQPASQAPVISCMQDCLCCQQNWCLWP
jgi:hypothetical protein